MQRLISVIIPVYNGEEYVEGAIRSVIAQTHPNWELIVIDDASTDGTCKKVREFAQNDNRIKLIECKTNFGGPARPRNIGIENARGEFIAFLDADDKWMPQKLEKQLDYLRKNNLDMAYTEAAYIGGSEGRAKPVESLCSLLLRNPITTSSVLLKNNMNVLFDEDRQLISVEDYYLWLHLYHKGFKMELMPESLVEYRIDGDSISHENDYNHLLKRYYAVFKFLISVNYKEPCLLIVVIQMFIKIIRIRFRKIFR